MEDVEQKMVDSITIINVDLYIEKQVYLIKMSFGTVLGTVQKHTDFEVEKVKIANRVEL